MRKLQQLYHIPHVHKLNANADWRKAKITRWFTNNHITKLYQTNYDYDASGNLTTLIRKDQNANVFDRFTYHYDATNKNRLLQVIDAVAPSVKTDDFDSQVNTNNYVYDLLGRVVEDKAKNLVQSYNKENKIITQTIGSKFITYKYDFQSKRVSKTVANGGLTTTEFYVRDPQGNVLAIYSDTLQNGRKLTFSELHIYGSSRLGIYKVDSTLWNNGVTPTISNVYTQKLGLKRYELSNHLGNVHVTISDRKIVQNIFYVADFQSVRDYYPFGKTIPERAVSKNRYDFNGKETDQESGYQDYGFRNYDVEVCRFLEVDPLHGKYPELSTYQFASNSPTSGIDLDGKEYYNATYTYRLQNDGTAKLIKTDYKRVFTLPNLAFAVPYLINYVLKGYGPVDMGVEFTLILEDEKGQEIKWQIDYQGRGKNGIASEITDYGIYSGPTTIWEYKLKDGEFIPDKSNNKTGYKGKADYNIPPIDPIDHAARIHDKRYEAVKAVGANGLFFDFATVEADMEASRSWKNYGTATANKQAMFFDGIDAAKKFKIHTFMENSGQIKKGLTSESAYLAFRAKYMLQDQDGNWTRKPGMWTESNKPKCEKCDP